MNDDQDKNEDLGDEIDMDDDSNFDEFETKERSLGALLNDNPMLKVGVIAGAVILIFAAIMLFSGKSSNVDQSFIGGGSDVSSAPGTEAISQDYVDAVQEVNERNVEIAQKTGGSALPTPIEPPVGVLSVPEPDTPQEDPLERWRRLQEERLERELQQTQIVPDVAPAQVDTGRQETVQAMAGLFSQQMSGILDSRTNTITHLPVTSESAFGDSLAARAETITGASGGSQDSAQQSEVIENILVPAGQIAYAQLLIEANNEAPGPILAQIISGPLNGSRALGSFETQNEVLTLSFNTVVIDGVSQSIDAIALDPATSLPGLATEVDHRYLRRVLLPAAAAFIEGAADAIAESGRTTVTIQGETVAEEEDETTDEQEIASGISEAGQEIGEILDDEADRYDEPLIRIEAGTPMGLLFLEPVIEEN